MVVAKPGPCHVQRADEGVGVLELLQDAFRARAPHGVASPLATMAYAHVCATVPNFMILEWTYYLNKQYTSLTEPVALQDGFLRVSDKPGIGVSLNDDAVKERTEVGYKAL